LAAVKQKGGSLIYASDEVKGCSDIILEAVTSDGTALRYASTELRDDSVVVLKAVQQKGGALKFASDALKENAEIVLKAFSNDTLALKFASDKLKADQAFILSAVKIDATAVLYASSELNRNSEFIQKASRQNKRVSMYSLDGGEDDQKTMLENKPKEEEPRHGREVDPQGGSLEVSEEAKGNVAPTRTSDEAKKSPEISSKKEETEGRRKTAEEEPRHGREVDPQGGSLEVSEEAKGNVAPTRTLDEAKKSPEISSKVSSPQETSGSPEVQLSGDLARDESNMNEIKRGDSPDTPVAIPPTPVQGPNFVFGMVALVAVALSVFAFRSSFSHREL